MVAYSKNVSYGYIKGKSYTNRLKSLSFLICYKLDKNPQLIVIEAMQLFFATLVNKSWICHFALINYFTIREYFLYIAGKIYSRMQRSMENSTTICNEPVKGRI